MKLITLSAAISAASALMLMPPPLSEAQIHAIQSGNETAAEEQKRSVGSAPESSHAKRANPDPASLGLDDVAQQAGYLNTDSGNQLFYWLFESRGNPSEDPLVIWLNGGPGCSSLEAALFENGPASLNGTSTIVHNPYSWNSFSNLMYIDNPAGVGYSVAQESVSDSLTASADFKSALTQFFNENPQYKSHKLHISGESYAGRYIPVFTEDINTDPSFPVKVSSAMIGNGLVNPVAEYAAYQPMLCGEGGYPSVLSDLACDEMKQQTPGCLSQMQNCMDSLDEFTCLFARYTCGQLERQFEYRNPYDIRDATCEPSTNSLCYTELDDVQDYFNQQNVIDALGSQVSDFQVCNMQMDAEFYLSLDPYYPTYKNVTNLLGQGTPILVYHGDKDIILNWLGGRQWTHDLEWSGQSSFQSAINSPVDWTPANGQKRGEVSNFEHFTFLRLSDAGHMVPHDQPESAYYMAKEWVSGNYALS